MYYVVEFQEDSDVGLVPDNWMVGDSMCYWPPYRNVNMLNKAARTSQQPDTDTWRLYKVGRILYKSDSYDKARKKLPMATETSDLYTEEEVSTRRKRPNQRYLSSSDEEDELPHLQKRQAIITRPIVPSPPRQVSPQPSTSTGIRRSPRRQPLRTSLFSPASASPAHQRPVTPPPPPQPQPQPQRPVATAAERAILTAIEKATEKIDENSALLRQLLMIMQSMTPQQASSSGTGPAVHFPLSSYQEMDDAEAQLTDLVKIKEAVNDLGLIGGVTISDTVRRVLSAMFTNELAKKINWKGTHQKRPFKDLKLKDVVIRAARRNPICSKATDIEFADKIQKWFRYAHDRCGGRRIRWAQKQREKEPEDRQEQPIQSDGE